MPFRPIHRIRRKIANSIRIRRQYGKGNWR
jgi:hypothetical protein